MNQQKQRLSEHLAQLKDCRLCKGVVGPVVTHGPVLSKILLCGQAPGVHEGKFGRPFSWTAGKTLFRWLAAAGVSEELFRKQAYIAAVCRCFPGKSSQGGDRVPAQEEISNCSQWLQSEFEILQPSLVIPVGRLAIEAFLPGQKLAEVVGKSLRRKIYGITCDIICLPHPSGASTWYKVEPGAALLEKAIELLAAHAVFRQEFFGAKAGPSCCRATAAPGGEFDG